MKTSFSNRDDILDSRDIIERIEELLDEKDVQIEALTTKCQELQDDYEELADEISELDGSSEHRKSLEAKLEDIESELEAATEELKDYEFDEEDELAELLALQEEAEGYASGWRHGETLIRGTYWKEYVHQLLEDLGELPKDLPSYIEIDWDATADNIAADYAEVDYGGVTYLIRCS